MFISLVLQLMSTNDTIKRMLVRVAQLERAKQVQFDSGKALRHVV